MPATPNTPRVSILENADPQLQSACAAIRRLAAQNGAAAYLVGGPVRDSLLGAPVNDLDITIVGDAPALAASLANAIGGRLTIHPRFGTATVTTANIAIDLVTARRETYPSPGALPEVRPGSIGNDLARRDFSVNAMAVPIANSANSAASILDPYGGRADLAAGVIRTLHPQSFRDDPTRILRAARYARRFAFRIADDTLTQLRAALAGGAMDTLTGDRVRHELERILQEPRPLAALRYAGELGALAAIHLALSVAHLRHLPPDTPAAPLTWLAALVWPLGPAQGNALAGRLNAPAGWSRVIADTAELAARLPRLAAPGLPPSASCARLDGLSPHAMDAAVLLAPPPAAERIRRYRAEWRTIKPRLRGGDLLDLGIPAGPAVGAALRALRQARLDGLTHSRQDETRLARQWASPAE